MTDKERMMELVELFTDADKRAGMSAEELAYCPNLINILYVMGD